MQAERKALLEELREHTEDCDCARSQHFFEEKRSKNKKQIFSSIQAVVFLTTIAIYVVTSQGNTQSALMDVTLLVLAVVSTLLEILASRFKFEEEAIAHWKSAQMYSELYRKCQFFYAHYSDASLEVWKEKLEEISEELSRISLLSPSVSQESYIEWQKSADKKIYPIDRVMDCLEEELQNAIDDIIKTFKNSKIEIFLFGSYLYSLNYKDIDIAVIVHEGEKKLKQKEALNKIESEYAKRGLNLDITLIYDADIKTSQFTMFLKNIYSGKCYYKSPNIKKNMEESNNILEDYIKKEKYYEDQAEEMLDKYASFMTNAFYMYYYTLAVLLHSFDITWYGEESLIVESELIISQEDKIKTFGISKTQIIDFIEHARLFKDEKEVAFLNNSYNKDEFNTIKEYFEVDKNIAEKIVKKMGLHCMLQ